MPKFAYTLVESLDFASFIGLSVLNVFVKTGAVLPSAAVWSHILMSNEVPLSSQVAKFRLFPISSIFMKFCPAPFSNVFAKVLDPTSKKNTYEPVFATMYHDVPPRLATFVGVPAIARL